MAACHSAPLRSTNPFPAPGLMSCSVLKATSYLPVRPAGHCAKCGAQFAVFFPAGDDADNSKYLAIIEKTISDDCKTGKHAQEILLNATS